MDEETIKKIIREELGNLIKSDRYIFEKLIQLADGRNIMVGTNTGTKIGIESTQKLGFFNTTPISQPSQTQQRLGFLANTGDAVLNFSSFTGGTGSSTYTIGDIIYHLKLLGLLAS